MGLVVELQSAARVAPEEPAPNRPAAPHQLGLHCRGVKMQQVTTRDQAIALGLKKYFILQKCRNGNIAERYVKGGGCLCDACKLQADERKRAHYLRNKERICEELRLARATNPEAVRQKDRERYIRNRKSMLEQRKAYYEKNRDKTAAYKQAWHLENADRLRAKAKLYYQENKERAKEYWERTAPLKREAYRERAKAWREANPDMDRANKHRRRAARLERMPAWYSEFDDFVASECVALCRGRELATGVQFHVDHLIPLLAKRASGLHCGMNLQVIPGFLNMRKKNRMMLTEPDEWLSRLA